MVNVERQPRQIVTQMERLHAVVQADGVGTQRSIVSVVAVWTFDNNVRKIDYFFIIFWFSKVNGFLGEGVYPTLF